MPQHTIMKLLVTRFSALGDVAMTVPVIYAVATQNEDIEITVMSKGFCAPLFAAMPANVTFRGVDFIKDYRGVNGLRRLVRSCGVDQFDAVADLHDVLRTKYIRFYAMLHGLQVAAIDKDRCGRAALVRQRDKQLEQQKTGFAKYQTVFETLGLKADLTRVGDLGFAACEPQTDLPAIGIAPFAAHDGKIYPLEKMREVVRQLSDTGRCHIYLFGGGQKERDVLETWEKEFTNVSSVADRLGGLDKELALMKTLRCMVSMDSANMHLASLVDTPVVSVWGATHPYAGFMGWRQNEVNAIQVDLPCRPCSIFGNKPCLRGNYDCMNAIYPDIIVAKALAFIPE